MTLHYVFDGGHGGKDPGGSGNGLKEKDLVLYMTKKAKAYLESMYEGIKVTLTRSTDVFLELHERTAIANRLNADGFVSFHTNAGGGTGYETFIAPVTLKETADFASDIHEEIMKAYGGKDRGIKRGNFHVIRESTMKAALLEFLFVDSSTDAGLLKQTAFLDKMAKAVAVGIAKHEGLKTKAVAAKPVQKPIVKKPTTGKLYYVQVGAFSSKANADAQAARIEKEGFQAIVKYE